MASDPPTPTPLRIMVANERDERLALVAEIVGRLGHDVIPRHAGIAEIGALTRAEQPDVALVGVGLDSAVALDHITKIVHEAMCPVIALLDASDPAYVSEAARRGVFAYVVLDDDHAALRSALEITLRRFAEFHNLEGAFGRRAVIEQAKGILMERHGIDAEHAFQKLRQHSQSTGRRLADLAQAVVESHRLLIAPAAEGGSGQTSATTPRADD